MRKRDCQLLILVPLFSMLVVSAFAQPSQSVVPVYEQVLSSREWQEFNRHVEADYFREINVRDLEVSCKKTIDPTAIAFHQRAIENCIRAAVVSLDSRAEYFSSTEWKAQRESSERRFVGIGVELRPYAGGNGYVEVVSTIKRSPAEKAGLRAGDLIYSIDGASTKNLTLTESVKVMRGVAGSLLTLLIRRAETADPIKFVVMREDIRVHSVHAKLLSTGIAYLRVPQFAPHTRSDVILDIQKLLEQNPTPLQALVLDLRNCQGGLLSATVGVTSLFVEPGTEVLRVSGRRQHVNRIYRAVEGDYSSDRLPQRPEPANWPLKSVRLIVLVNEKTASGAEALVAHLKERRQATIVGRPTFGSSEIETIFTLESGAAIRIITGMMFPPSGHSWQDKGIGIDVFSPRNERADWEFGTLPEDAELALAIGHINRK